MLSRCKLLCRPGVMLGGGGGLRAQRFLTFAGDELMMPSSTMPIIPARQDSTSSLSSGPWLLAWTTSFEFILHVFIREMEGYFKHTNFCSQELYRVRFSQEPRTIKSYVLKARFFSFNRVTMSNLFFTL